MPQCRARKTNGDFCQGIARHGYDLCPYHRKKFGNLSHGRNAKAETLAIPKSKRLTFQQFVDLKDPFGLQNELAALRTLMVEQRESMEKNRPDYLDSFISDIIEKGSILIHEETKGKVSQDKAKKLLNIAKPVMEEAYQSYIGDVSDLSVEEVKARADLIKDVAYTAEKAKKIADGITIAVDIKAEAITTFIREFILPNIPDHATRMRIVEAASMYRLSHRPNASLSLPSGEEETVYDVEAQ